VGEVQRVSAITDLIAGIVGGLGKTAIDLRTAITGKDPAQDAKLAQLALELETQKAVAEAAITSGQLEVNKVEAASPKMFIAGARPAILWIGALVILYNYVLSPLLRAAGVALPELALSDLWPVITGILGLGTMRTVEKLQGAAGNH
jgi:hypothetical protein